MSLIDKKKIMSFVDKKLNAEKTAIIQRIDKENPNTFYFKKDILRDYNSNIVFTCKTNFGSSVLSGGISYYDIKIYNIEGRKEVDIKYLNNPLSFGFNLNYRISLNDKKVGKAVCRLSDIEFSFNNCHIYKERILGSNKWVFYNQLNEPIAVIIKTSGFSERFKVLFEQEPNNFYKTFVIISIMIIIASEKIDSSRSSEA